MKKLLTTLFILISICAFSFAQNGTIPLKSGSHKSNTVECMGSKFDGFTTTVAFNTIESELIDTPEGLFSSIFIDGAYNSGDLGTPQLPSFHKLIYIPEGATPKIIVKGYTTAEYKLSDYDITTIYPAQRSYSKSEKPENMKFEYNRQEYKVSKSNNTEIASIEILGSMREVVIGKLFVNPVRYNYEDGTIIVYNDIDIDVVFENADMSTAESKIKRSYSPYFSEIYKRLLNGKVIANISDPKPGDLLKYPVSMVVIANRLFEESLKPWVVWKAMKGFDVEVKYTDEIGSTPEDIKLFCANMYKERVESSNGASVPSFLVLVGDVAQVAASAMGTYPNDRKTDLYYGSIDGDMYPEMFYSRISVTTPTELTNYINKSIYYEKYNFEDPSYLDDVTLIAGWDDQYNAKFGQPTMKYWLQNYFNTENGFDKVNSWLDRPYTGCYDNLNAGVSLINYTAHGWMDEWSDPRMTTNMVNSLTNTNKYSIAIGNCCLTSDFGYGVCFGESWIRAANKGAVGYIGSAPSSYWSEDCYWSVGAYKIDNYGTPATVENSGVGVYDALFSDTFTTLCGMITVGNMAVDEAVSKGYNTSVGSLYYWQAYNVLGDGSISPYIRQGKENIVQHAEAVYIGLETFKIDGAVPGSYVALSREGVIAGTAITNEDGVATIQYIHGKEEIMPGGDYDLVVTRAGYKPYFVKLTPKSLDEPYIVIKEYKVDNEEQSLINNEESTLTLTLENLGKIATTNEVSVKLSCDDKSIKFIDDSETYPVINGNEKASKASGFKLKVDNKTPNQHLVVINYTATSGSASWTGKIKLNVIAPELKFAAYEIKDGLLIKGAIGHITVNIENAGDFIAKDVDVMLISASEYVYILEKEPIVLGNIDKHAKASAGFDVYVTPDLPVGYTANFDVNIDGVKINSFAISWDEYCVPEITECENDRIIDVIFAGINNVGTDCSDKSYGDYTSQIGTVEAGKTYTFTTKAGYASDRIYAWIDYNENGIFESTELAVNNLICENKANQYSADVKISASVVPGTKRMRVRSFWSSSDIIPDPCTVVTKYGETEDYTVVISTPYIKPTAMLVAAESESNAVKITWVAPQNASPDGYRIYRDGTLLSSTIITECSFTDKPNKSDFYVYSLVAVYGVNESLPIYGFIDYKYLNAVSEVDDNVLIYPNPTSSIINVKADDIEIITLIDMSGRVLNSYKINDNQAVINISALNQGVYLMVIKTAYNTIHKNVIRK